MTWQPLRPDLCRALSDTRRQLHHAAQLATAFGISYVDPRDDDSHASLEWLPDAGAIASRPVRDVRVALRVRDLTLLVNGHEFALRDQTIERGAEWVRERLSGKGLPQDRYTLTRHFEIPPHPVGEGQPFTADAGQLEELSKWFGNAAELLTELAATRGDASEVRCWPHHFDIASLISVSPGKTIGVGMEPGDEYYDEPYLYVNLHPAPAPDALHDAPSGGTWHKRDWIGAVLPGSRLPTEPAAQAAFAKEFIRSAVRTNERLLADGQLA